MKRTYERTHYSKYSCRTKSHTKKKKQNETRKKKKKIDAKKTNQVMLKTFDDVNYIFCATKQRFYTINRKPEQH